MNWMALRMLFGDRTKSTGLIFGITLATFLMAQQLAIFISFSRRSASQVEEVGVDIWVMREQTRQIDEARGLPAGALARVRGVAGVKWAVPHYKGPAWVQLEDGKYRNVILVGVDDTSLVGMPPTMILGQADDLNQPDAFLVDKAGYDYMWPGQPYQLGRTVELNDHRAVLVGICAALPPFVAQPILYTRQQHVSQYVPRPHDQMPFILVKVEENVPVAEVCRRIHESTGLLALTEEQFFWQTIKYLLGSTGIALNFGITISLGFMIGAAISGGLFFQFVQQHLPQFGMLKALGVSNFRLMKMIWLQGAVVGFLGYSLGIGLAAGFMAACNQTNQMAGSRLYWHALAAAALGVGLILTSVSVIVVRRLSALEPAIVFRG